MTRSLLVTLTIFLGICSLAASNNFHNPQEDTVLFYNIFKDWITQSHKQYGIEEMAIRFFNWKSNFDFVQEHNTQYGLTYKLEMNDFADMTAEEFSALHMGLNTELLGASKSRNNSNSASKNAAKTNSTKTNSTNSTIAKNNNTKSDGLPKSVDWRKSGAVSTVKNQGTCGGCYAFAAAGALEGLYAIKNKQLTDISVQQMIDCSEFFGNKGCDGGLMTTTFGFTSMFGVESETGYAYAAKAGDCKQNSDKVLFKNSGHEEVPQNDTLALKKAVAQQPVSVGIEASSLTVQLFKSGVITTGCGTALDHAVLIVGYDTDKNGQDYWIVKNSWGPKWGQKGYFNVAMGSQNSGMGVCGINLLASYPTL